MDVVTVSTKRSPHRAAGSRFPGRRAIGPSRRAFLPPLAAPLHRGAGAGDDGDAVAIAEGRGEAGLAVAADGERRARPARRREARSRARSSSVAQPAR